MKKLAALITACVLILSTCAVGASAAEYGRDVRCGDFTAQGEYIYYISDNKICRMHITDGKQKTVCEVIGEDPNSLCVMGNCLYYTSYDGYDKVYKLDIGSGKQTKILDCGNSQYEISVISLVTAGDRIYIIMSELIHDEVPQEYSIKIYDANGKYLSYLNTAGTFIDASNCEACAATEERKIVYTYPDYGDEDEDDWFDGDPDDWYVEYTSVYNILKIKSDLSNEKITIPAKIGKNVKKFVYCGKKYIYYIDNNYRLCRYNTDTEKYTVLFDGEAANAYYKDGAVYFLTNGGELKKYKKSKISTLDENVSAAYFFYEYILYYGENASLENDIPKVISFKTTG